MTTNNLAKWVDEIAGTIERIQKKISTFKVNTVEVEPVSENTGFKIADITVNGEKSTLKMVDISVTPEDNDGDKIGEITINGETTELNMPEIDFEPEFYEGTKLATFTLGDHIPTEIYMPQNTFVVSAPTAVSKKEIATYMGIPLYEAYIKVPNVAGSASSMTRLLDAVTGEDLEIESIVEFDTNIKVIDTNDLTKGTLFTPIGSAQSHISFQAERFFAGIVQNTSFQNNLMVGYNAPSNYVADFFVKIIFTTATI